MKKEITINIEKLFESLTIENESEVESIEKAVITALANVVNIEKETYYDFAEEGTQEELNMGYNDTKEVTPKAFTFDNKITINKETLDYLKTKDLKEGEVLTLETEVRVVHSPQVEEKLKNIGIK